MSLSAWQEATDPVAIEVWNSEKRFRAPEGLERAQRHLVMKLYDEHYGALLAYLRSLGLTAEDAEDVANETFVRLMKQLTELCRYDNLRGWLYRVAHNLAVDVHRANRRFCYAVAGDHEDAIVKIEEMPDPCQGPEGELIEKESRRKLRAAVMLLTLQQRRCLLLRAQGLRYREIAFNLGISLQRAATLLERGTARLRVNLQ